MKTLLINLKMHSLHRTGGCSELKFYFLLDCSDSWELGPKLVFRGSNPPLVFLTCVFSLALWILVVCSSCLCFVNRADLCNKSFYSLTVNQPLMKLVHYFTLIFFRCRELQEENRILAKRDGDIASKEKEIAKRIKERSDYFLIYSYVPASLIRHSTLKPP